MTDMRRTLLWVVFTMSLLLLWDAWQRHNGQPSMFSPAPAKPVATAASGAAGADAVPAATAAAGAGAGTAAGRADITGGVAEAGATLDISTDVLRVTFNERGAQVQGLKLLQHHETGAADRPIELFSGARRYFAQSGLITQQAGVALPNHTTGFTAVPGERQLKDGADSLSVSFESAEVGGVQLVKTYTFRRGQYDIAVTHELRNKGGSPVQPQLYLQLTRDGVITGNTNAFMGVTSFTGPAVYSDAGKFRKIEFADIAKNKAEYTRNANDGWVAMVQHYFTSAWLVPSAGPREFRTAQVEPNFYSVALVQPLAEVAPGASLKHEAVLFAGPQAEKTLEALAPGLELVKDYGWFTVLAKPLFWLLDKLHALIGNWGWAIVALVVLLKIAFYWLNASAYRSMAKMKAINPRVMELRERHKDNPQQMQQEMMRIYREEKVNPLGGCLPIMVQMPFFIALYWVLSSSVEMRGAPWVGWITDLSQPDSLFFTVPGIQMPVGLLPILMTASTLLQTWLNPTPPDPMQARLMWIMPIMFSFMFFYFPAGLVLYWLTNNLLSIAQQWLINKQLGVLGK